MSRKLILLLGLLLPLNGLADTSMWIVDNGEHRLYLGGTIHVLSADDYPLPDEFDEAYELSASVVLETDADALNGMGGQQQLLGAMMYRDGSSLQDHLSRSTWRKLEKHCAERGIPIASLSLFKVGMVAITLTVVELQRLGMLGEGVDQHFSNRAKSDGKSLQQFETVEQQVNFLSRLGEDDPDTAIRYTLRDIERLPSLFGKIKRHWRSGNLDGLAQTSLLPMRQEFPAVYDLLLVQRNRDWLPQLEALIASPEVEVVLVGALHLVGEDGLLRMLRDRGYEVTRF